MIGIVKVVPITSADLQKVYDGAYDALPRLMVNGQVIGVVTGMTYDPGFKSNQSIVVEELTFKASDYSGEINISRRST